MSQEFMEEFDSDDEQVTLELYPNIYQQFPQNCPFPQPPFYPTNQNLSFYPAAVPQTINPPEIQKQKRRKRHCKLVKLSDCEDSIKTYAWDRFQLERLQKKLQTLQGNAVNEDETQKSKLEMAQKIEAIKKNISSQPIMDEDMVKRLVKKFKSQKAKRDREKRKSERRAKIHQTIDNWQMEQRQFFEKQRKQLSLLSDRKKSLLQLRKRKESLQERSSLIRSLEKLRELRRKRCINTEAKRTSLSEIEKSTEEFNNAIRPLKERLEIAVKRVIEKESKINSMIHQSESGESGIKSYKNKSNTPALQLTAAEEQKKKRDEKWAKYLYKKAHKMHNLS